MNSQVINETKDEPSSSMKTSTPITGANFRKRALKRPLTSSQSEPRMVAKMKIKRTKAPISPNQIVKQEPIEKLPNPTRNFLSGGFRDPLEDFENSLTMNNSDHLTTTQEDGTQQKLSDDYSDMESDGKYSENEQDYNSTGTEKMDSDDNSELEIDEKDQDDYRETAENSDNNASENHPGFEPFDFLQQDEQADDADDDESKNSGVIYKSNRKKEETVRRRTKKTKT